MEMLISRVQSIRFYKFTFDFFSKLTRQTLKGIRVKTKEELIDRIYKYFDEVNEEPVVYHWKYKLDEIDPSEKVKVETLPLKSS